ncbi:MAG: cytochrome c, partial [Thermoanaerobaculia bacterium]|nr:cytochrome c [Thermoanaerobaculia bacterium]
MTTGRERTESTMRRLGVGRERFAAASGALLLLLAAGATWLALCAVSGEPWPSADRETMTGEELYRAACASCHGIDGRGARKGVVGFTEPVPDFTECSFATREPDADWFGIVHDGGPVRGFARMMPALGDVLEDREIQTILDHVRTFCSDPAWPRGELNLPRPLVTEKAFPEDEVVYELNVSTTGGPGRIGGQVVYEKRFGARNQYEVLAPVAWRESVPGHEEDSWVGGVGDLGVAVK